MDLEQKVFEHCCITNEICDDMNVAMERSVVQCTHLLAKSCKFLLTFPSDSNCPMTVLNQTHTLSILQGFCCCRHGRVLFKAHDSSKRIIKYNLLLISSHEGAPSFHKSIPKFLSIFENKQDSSFIKAMSNLVS